MKQPRWFRIENSSDPSVADIHIIDLIGDWLDDYFGFGVTAKSFVDQLAKLPEAVKTIRVHINSPGGDVFGAVNIANALRDQRMSKGRTVDVLIEGLAASAASIVIMAGNTIRIGDNAMVMIHNPWSIAVGESKDMRKTADDLDAIRGTILATYRWQSKLSEAELGALMDAETWMDADAAITNGFATEKVVGLQAAASLDRSALAKLKIPEQYRARVEALVVPPAPEPAAASATDTLDLVAAAGLGTGLAQELIKTALPLEQVKARIAAAQAAKDAEASRSREITALCAAAKLPIRADWYIKTGLTVKDVQADLTTITALLDKAEIDATLLPDQGHDAAASWSEAIAKVQGPRKGALR